MTPYTNPDPTIDDFVKQGCSYCQSTYTKFVRYEQDSEGNALEVYVCRSCNTTFKVLAKEIPF